MAGFVSFKLCNYQYECEKCPFDKVMKKNKEFIPQKKTMTEDLSSIENDSETKSPKAQPDNVESLDFDKFFQKFYDIKIRKNLYYHYGHTWVEIESHDCVKVGMDDFAGKFILAIKMIISPGLETQIDQGKVFCWIVEQNGTLPVLAPITGQVLSLNPQIPVEPILVNNSPYEQGWLLKVRPQCLQRDLKKLYNDDDALIHYKKDVTKLKSKFESYLTRNWNELGPTLCDGGNMYIHVRDMIGAKRYFDIISDFFTKK